MQQIIKSEKEDHVPQESSDVRNQLVIIFWGHQKWPLYQSVPLREKGRVL